jgi:orotidine-5'-phosphate decarboxylase
MAPDKLIGARNLPSSMADRLIVALDVPTIRQAQDLVGQLEGTVRFFKIGLWLAFAEGVDGLIHDLVQAQKRVFLDAKMYDIGKTVEEGVARAADRGVSFVTVHGDGEILASAVKGKRGTDIQILAVTVLTSLNDANLFEMGYRLTAQELVQRRVRSAIEHGIDGIIASAQDDPDALRRDAGADSLLVVTPGIRGVEDAANDHQRLATPHDAIKRGADYLVVGRPVVHHPAPAVRAAKIIQDMQAGAEQRG